MPCAVLTSAALPVSAVVCRCSSSTPARQAAPPVSSDPASSHKQQQHCRKAVVRCEAPHSNAACGVLLQGCVDDSTSSSRRGDAACLAHPARPRPHP
ncbi:hypothetical protein COO60DRAFT_125646 [Scenedesmus sp. NREL 46B-D3]|nr:hypothetical protein COO60DRAFT_125646 [Scenedesmus sp. NREL 46B-D3]